MRSRLLISQVRLRLTSRTDGQLSTRDDEDDSLGLHTILSPQDR